MPKRFRYDLEDSNAVAGVDRYAAAPCFSHVVKRAQRDESPASRKRGTFAEALLTNHVYTPP